VVAYVALLRGINVGGKNLIKMSELKACFEVAGFQEVVTYIQSGNVLSDPPGQVRLRWLAGSRRCSPRHSATRQASCCAAVRRCAPWWKGHPKASERTPLARGGGERFTFTFGAAEDPAQYWRREEAAGGEPMKFLAGMLERPYRQSSTGDLVLYVWPSAATYPSWAEVPPEDRNVLRPLYGDEEFEQFAGFGSYIGYRVGITDTGDWLYFVAGD